MSFLLNYSDVYSSDLSHQEHPMIVKTNEHHLRIPLIINDLNPVLLYQIAIPNNY